MKTFSIILLFSLFSGSLSFGTGNETCCPDTNLRTLVPTSQLDQLQSESLQMVTSTPSLQAKVNQKLDNENSILDKIQLETEQFNVSSPLSVALTSALDSRLPKVVEESSDEQVRKF